MQKLIASGAILIGALTATLALLAAFGVHLSQDQKEAIIGVVGPYLALVGVFFHPGVGKKKPPPTVISISPTPPAA